MESMDGLEEAQQEPKTHTQSPKIISIQPTSWSWPSSTSSILILFSILFLTSALLYRIDFSTITGTSIPYIEAPFQPKTKFPFDCSNEEAIQQACAADHTSYYKSKTANLSSATCPDYFRWIYEDLRPWKATGISRDAVEGAKEFAHFRLVIVDGKAYLEKFKNAYQTRDLFNIWGFLQLLRLYPGKLPDLELMFQCEDTPLVMKEDHLNATAPPITFQYCGRDDAVGVVFPDWSFWGWGGLNIRPWKYLVEDLEKGNEKIKWKDRIPYAYWKGNPYVSRNRRDLMRCGTSWFHEWKARIYKQDWVKETRRGFQHSKLENQCTHRYKIYIEGRGWSVSEKYIMACDSMTLFVDPVYYNFFDRSLMPLQHIWPIRRAHKCKDIKFAVEWGNIYPDEAQTIGKAGSKFIKESVKMEYVYDYMFHVLSEYSKLLKFKPEVPKGAVELCSERMGCSEQGPWKEFMGESMIKLPSDTPPCAIPPPHQPQERQDFLDRKKNISNQVVMWEKEQWNKLPKKLTIH